MSARSKIVFDFFISPEMAAIVANSIYESICPGSYSRIKAKSTDLVDEGLGSKLVVSFMHVQNSQIIVRVL